MTAAPHYCIGLSTSGHDPALAIVDDSGRVLFAEASERAMQLKVAWGIAPDHPAILQPILDLYCEPEATFTVATSWAASKAGLTGRIIHPMLQAEMATWLGRQHAHVNESAGTGIAALRGAHRVVERLDIEHHLCHAAHACHSAPFDDAVCAVIDGEGDVGSVSIYDYADGRIARRWRSWGPGSLGAFYAWLTDLCGFDARTGEQWKLMGLAAFGTPREPLMARLRELVTIEAGRPMSASEDVVAAVGAAIAPSGRRAGEPVMQAADLAASAQAIYAGYADAVLTAAIEGGASRNLILTGGCALNSAYNGTVQGRLGPERVHVPPAPGDDGNAVGAALVAWMRRHPGSRLPQYSPGGDGSPHLGTAPDRRSIEAAARHAGGLAISACPDPAGAVADRLAAGAIVGVMRGRAEYGPRALGHRSILADPTRADMKDRINERVKGREPYRPFAPAVRAANADRLFRNAQPSPYMSFTLAWREAARSRYPATVHADGTGRVQTVPGESWLDDVLLAFEARTGAEAILNTSLNVMGKPMVHSTADAVAVLMTTGLDALLMDDVMVEKDGG